MFKFENTVFNSSMVVAVMRRDETVSVYVHGREDSFDWDYDDEDAAKKKFAQAWDAWKQSVSPALAEEVAT